MESKHTPFTNTISAVGVPVHFGDGWSMICMDGRQERLITTAEIEAKLARDLPQNPARKHLDASRRGHTEMESSVPENTTSDDAVKAVAAECLESIERSTCNLLRRLGHDASPGEPYTIDGRADRMVMATRLSDTRIRQNLREKELGRTPAKGTVRSSERRRAEELESLWV